MPTEFVDRRWVAPILRFQKVQGTTLLGITVAHSFGPVRKCKIRMPKLSSRSVQVRTLKMIVCQLKVVAERIRSRIEEKLTAKSKTGLLLSS